MSIIPSQPSSNTKLIRISLKLYGRSFSKIILLSFLLAITAFIPQLISVSIGHPLNIPIFSLNRLWLLIINLLALVFFIGILWHMRCVIRNIHEPLIQDLKVGLKKFGYAFLAGLIQGLIIYGFTLIALFFQYFLLKQGLFSSRTFLSAGLTTLFFMVQFVLFIYVYSLFLFFVPLITVENRGVFSSLEQSASLVWNHWWRIIFTQITPWICYFAALVIIKRLFHVTLPFYFLTKSMLTWWSLSINIIVFAFFVPWFAALLLVQLKDLELRKKNAL